MNYLHAAAITLHNAGLAVVPIASDGTKRPAVTWKAYQSERPTRDQIDTWFAPGSFEGLGVLTGEVSGQLEMLETEGRAVQLVPQLAGLFAEHGLGELWTRLCSGWMERSPSGGLHWFYRVAGEARSNTKLARRPGETTGTVDVLIETRGAGGFVVTAPSGGRAHPTGEAWTIVAGGPATIPTLTVEERDAVYLACAAFDRMPTLDAPAPRTPGPSTQGDQLRPGDDYNTRATWDDILGSRGWTKVKALGGAIAWTRPGKHPRDGISATTGRNDGDNLYVFTSSTEFEQEVPYSKFGAYALLEHGGDHGAAAKALRGEGYGAPIEDPRPNLTLAPEPADPLNIDPSRPSEAKVEQPGAPAETSYSLTDDGNALRLVDNYADCIRYCPQKGAWLAWNGHRWEWDEAGTVTEYARTIARSLKVREAETKKHRQRSLSHRGVKDMVGLARSDARITVGIDDLDARPYELNTPGGVVDLRTGQINTPDPAALHTRSTEITPQPGPAPKWERFLADTFAGDPAMTLYMQRVLGQALVGQVLEQILPFAFGSGANGKTTTFGVVQRLVGIGEHGYAISAPAELLLATAQAGHPTEYANLAGARIVVTSELEDGQRFAEAKVKRLTGRDAIAARFMRQDWFTFIPTHTLFLLANHQPEVRAGGEAFWRRIRLMPFLHTVPPEERNPHLEDELVDEEGPQILQWMIQGAADYFRDGLAVPASVEAATASYALDQDGIGRFVEECCETAPAGRQGYSIRSSELRQAYETWCRVEGEQPVSIKAMTMALKSRFDVTPSRTSSSRVLDGIRLKADEEASSDASLDASQSDDREWYR